MYQPMPRAQNSGESPVCLLAQRSCFDCVPAVVEQAGLRIARVLLHEHELLRDVGEFFGMMGDGSVFGAEGLGHVEAVEPHLVGIALLVPVAAFGVARLLRELIVEEGGGGEVALVLRDAVEEEKLAAEEDVVELMLFGLERGDGAVGCDELIDGGS